MTTGLDAKSLENLQLDAGVFLRNFDYSNIKTTAELRAALATAAANAANRMGATRGDGVFSAVPQRRSPEMNGKRYEYVGGTRYDSWEIKMTGTLLETTAQNIRDVLSTADFKKDGDITTLTLRTQPKKEDYMNLVWVGDTAYGMIMICLKNALNVAGMTFTFTDKGEGTLPFEFHAHQAAVTDYDKAPFEIKLLEEPAAA